MQNALYIKLCTQLVTAQSNQANEGKTDSRVSSRLDVTQYKIYILLMAVQEKRVAGLTKRLVSDDQAWVCIIHDLTITSRASAATRPCADKNTVACESPDLNFATLDVTNPAKELIKVEPITGAHVRRRPFKRGAAAAPTSLIMRRSLSTYAVAKSTKSAGLKCDIRQVMRAIGAHCCPGSRPTYGCHSIQMFDSTYGLCDLGHF